MQPGGGTRDVLFVRHGDEIPQVPKFHSGKHTQKACSAEQVDIFHSLVCQDTS